MPTRRPGANLRRGPGSLSGTEIEALNKLHPGLGTAINSRLGFLANRGDALSGQRGTVRLAPQEKQDQRGVKEPALALSKDRLSGLADPIDDEDAVSLGYLRRLFNCDWFEDLFDDCIDVELGTSTTTILPGGEIPYFFGWTIHPPNETDTIIADQDTGGTERGWSLILPEATEVSKVSIGLAPYSALSTFRGNPVLNIGLRDANYNLLFETGPFPIQDPNAPPRTQISGFFTLSVNGTFSLPPGEYFQIFASNTCMRIWCIAFNDPVWRIMEASGRERIYNFGAISNDAHLQFTPVVGPPFGSFDAFPFAMDIPVVLYEK